MPKVGDIVTWQQKPDAWSEATNEVGAVIEIYNYGWRNVSVVAKKSNGDEVPLTFDEYKINRDPQVLEDYLRAMELRSSFKLPAPIEKPKSSDDYMGWLW
jgi:hypothetical protein